MQIEGLDFVTSDLLTINPSAHRDAENEQVLPLPANGTFTGQWHSFKDMHCTIIRWASDARPIGVFVEWSPDGINPGTGPYDVTPLHVQNVAGSWSVADVENIGIESYMRLFVQNGATPQTWVTSSVACTKGAFTGVWSALSDPLSPLVAAAVHRAVLAAQQPDGSFNNVIADTTGAIQTSTQQVKDVGNSILCPPTAMPTPTSPWKGTPFKTLASGIVGSTFSIVGSAGKSGTLIFNYSSTMNQTPANVPVRVPLHIPDLGQPLLVPLQNVMDYFWLEFVPDDSTGTFLAVSCIHQKAAPPELARFLSQTVTDNEPGSNAKAFLFARKPDGTWPAVALGQVARTASLSTTLAVEDLAALAKDASLAALNGKDYATQTTLAALLAKLETGLAKTTDLTTLATQATLALVAKDATLALRPSQFPGRTHIDRNAAGVTALTTLYTVTAGKTFYLTSLIYCILTTAVVLTTCSIRDGITVKIPFALPIAGGQTPPLSGALAFPEPIPFTTSVVVAPSALTVNASVTIAGYEQ